MRIAEIVVIAALAAAGCNKDKSAAEGPKVDMSTVRGTADGAVAAFAARDPNRAIALLPPVDLIKKSFDCPGDELAKKIEQRKQGAQKEMGGMAKDVTVAISAFDKTGSQDTQLRKGDEWQGCKAKELVTVHDSKIDLTMTHDGKTEFQNETWTFIKFGDEPSWYLFP